MHVWTSTRTGARSRAQAIAIRARCFSRLTPGQLVDTTMDTEPDSIALDTTGDGKVDKVVPIADKDKYT